MLLDILKCHGSSNDFLLIDELTTDLSFSETERSELALSLCKRDGELGADGILFVMKSDVADARMRVFNPDGTEASMCGNGLRCVARFVYEKLNLEQMVIETMKANLAAAKTADIYDGIPTFSVEISPISFKASDLPLAIDKDTLRNETLPSLSETIAFTALAVPNPHAIALVDWSEIDSNLQEELASQVNGPNDLFPDGVNMSFVKHLKEGEIFVRTYERGVGFTNACGTAMSASSLVTCELGLNQPETPISVYNNGGKVQCVVHNNQSKTWIDLIGNGSYIYQASVDIHKDYSYQVIEKQAYTNEITKYAEFQQHAQDYLKSIR